MATNLDEHKRKSLEEMIKKLDDEIWRATIDQNRRYYQKEALEALLQQTNYQLNLKENE